METEEKGSKFGKLIKLVIVIAVVVVIFVVIMMLTSSDSPTAIYTKKTKPTEEKDVVMTVTGDNKVQTYNTFTIDEWNGYRFKYRSDWIAKKKYDDKNNFIGVILYPNEKKNDNDYILVGGEKKDCEDVKMTKCSISGYGLIMQSIYTYSNEEGVFSVYDALINSISDFQGKTEFNIESARNTIKTFLNAQKENKFNLAREVMSPSLLNEYDSRLFNVSREGSMGKYEFIENSQRLQNDYYKVPVRVHAYYNDEKNEIGYWDYVFSIRVANEKYLIDEINIKSFQSK